MTIRRVGSAIIAAAGLSLIPQASHADMGKAPGGPGIILSFEGGYLYQDGSDIVGHGTSPVINTPPGSPFSNVLVSPQDGYFVGGHIGYENGTPFLFGFHRAELSFLYGETDDSATSESPPFIDIILKTVDGTVLGTGGAVGVTTTERQTWEGALRFEDDDVVNATTTVTWVFAPFIRNFEEDTRSVISTVVPCCDFTRTASVDTTLYGIYVAAEPETWLTSNLALVGRLGAGVYGYDADGSFRSFGTASTTGDFNASISDGDSGAGFRGLLGVGLKFKVTSATLLEGFAEADYFSSVPTADLSTNDPSEGYESRTDDEDLWEFRTGVRLTVGLGGAN